MRFIEYAVTGGRYPIHTLQVGRLFVGRARRIHRGLVLRGRGPFSRPGLLLGHVYHVAEDTL